MTDEALSTSAPRAPRGGTTPQSLLLQAQGVPDFRSVRSMVYPVSRVGFELSDTDAFERSIALAVEWMSSPPRRGAPRPRSGGTLPAGALRGETFDITDELGANPTKAVRLEAQDGVLWAARLDWPDDQEPRTWVSEFFVEKRSGRMVRFGAQLTCVRRGECSPTVPTRPSVVRRILETLSAEADGRHLSDTIEQTEVDDIGEVIALLYADTRRLPVLVVSEPEAGKPGFLVRDFTRQIGGAAHIVHISAEASWALTRQVGKRMSVFRGAARLYQPGLSEANEDPFAHPLWLPHHYDHGSVGRQIASRVLPAAFLDRSEHAFPRYAEVRDAASRLEARARRAPTSAPPADLLAISELRATELGEERDTWMSLAEEQQGRRLAAENEVERLKAEVARLEAKANMLEFNLGQRSEPEAERSVDRQLQSYEDLEDWSEEVLGDAVYIHSAALKDCRKNGHPAMLARIEAALLIMRDYMTPFRRAGDTSMRDSARTKLAELGFEDTACFADRDEAYRRPQYSVSHGGETRVLYDHLKYGNGYNNANQVRIYYFWDDNKRQHVVGKMPSHLRNNLTN